MSSHSINISFNKACMGFVAVKLLFTRNIFSSVTQDSGVSIITVNKGIILFGNLLTGSRLDYSVYRVTF